MSSLTLFYFLFLSDSGFSFDNTCIQIPLRTIFCWTWVREKFWPILAPLSLSLSLPFSLSLCHSLSLALRHSLSLFAILSLSLSLRHSLSDFLSFSLSHSLTFSSFQESEWPRRWNLCTTGSGDPKWSRRDFYPILRKVWFLETYLQVTSIAKVLLQLVPVWQLNVRQLFGSLICPSSNVRLLWWDAVLSISHYSYLLAAFNVRKQLPNEDLLGFLIWRGWTNMTEIAINQIFEKHLEFPSKSRFNAKAFIAFASVIAKELVSSTWLRCWQHQLWFLKLVLCDYAKIED